MSIEAIINSYENALTQHIYDEQNGDEIPKSEEECIAAARAQYGTLVEALEDALKIIRDVEHNEDQLVAHL